MTDGLARKIRERLDALGKTARAVSIEATGSPETIRGILSGRVRNPRIDTVQAIARALGLPAEELVALAAGSAPQEISEAPVEPVATSLLPRDVPVLGTAAGSLAGAFQLSDSPIDYVRRPPGLTNARDIYAIYIEGESMVPEHRPGDLRFVSPHKPPALGDTVIVQVRDHEAAGVQAYIKHLVRRGGEWLTLAQLNQPKELQLATASVVAVHKVLTLNELFGV
jgi:phage repressor protein C with HTH and peptisase S24 domain